MEISTMSIRGRVVRELSAEQLSCGPRLQTEVPQKLSPIKFGHFPFLTLTISKTPQVLVVGLGCVVLIALVLVSTNLSTEKTEN